ncbi:MAG TPA: aminopeptidase P N-terminal domain-containing protein [Bdellovibrionota bacterium]|jgi:Xaa-Pro aminopeptidase|nr:aminopeptidase P N-terminal domain-containing protein [Bdellovibrionota bacterium]
MTKNSSNLHIYKKRRDQIFDRLESHKDFVVMLSAPERIRNQDGEYLYRADSSVYYLSGFAEPECAIVLWKEGTKKRSVIFVRPTDPVKEHWTGRRLGVDRAAKALGFDEAKNIHTLWEFVGEWLRTVPQGRAPKLWTNAFSHRENLQAAVDFVATFKDHPRKKILGFNGLLSTDTWMQNDRTIKDKHEIELMRKSSEINTKAHLELLKEISTYKNESQVAAKIEYEFKKRGASGNAYNSICAAGTNATILHYSDNNAPIKKNDLVLIDAGCEYEMYASDITRTYPVSGKFTEAQRQVTEWVSKALLSCIDIARPGKRLTDVHLEAQKVLAEGLIDMGILKGTVSKVLKEGSHLKYFTHGTSHFLGLDTHDWNQYMDPKDYGSVKLAPGMVITVEPGLYFGEDDESVDAKWRGIGVRLEDDVLITKGKPEVLTAGLPRTVEEIEKFMAKHS